jgi:hypothetical protein
MNLNADVAAIFALDLDPIKAKLMHKESGEGWSQEHVNAVELEYRRFLALTKLFPDEPVAPLFNVDIFWHYHILDTMKYAADCEQAFGYFLHHFPYSGLRGEEDESVHQQISAHTRELYEATFGEAYVQQEAGLAVTQRLEATVEPAFCQPTTAKAAFCQPTTAKSGFCQPTTAKSGFCQPTTAKAAFCQPTTAKAAFCQPTTAKAAFCQPTTARAAFCQPTTAKAAFCQPTTAKTAFCQPTTAKAAFCQPAVAKMAPPHAVAQNDRAYLTLPLLANA